MVNAGEVSHRMEHVDREALTHNEKPYALSFFPGATSDKEPGSAVVLKGESVVLSAFKKAQSGNNFVFRLNETTGIPRDAVVQ